MSYSGKHAECYDLFYQDKPYREEAGYAVELIRARFPAAQTILDLGCGTGLRCLELARLGYKVSGVDLSASMLYASPPAPLGSPRYFANVGRVSDRGYYYVSSVRRNTTRLFPCFTCSPISPQR